MINTQQIIVLMPLFNIQMPANAQIFFEFIMELASLDILPMQKFYDKYLPSPFWDAPLSDKFYNLGFQSIFFLNNLGSMALGFAAIPLLSCVVLMLKPLSRFSRRITTFRRKLYVALFWSHQVTLLNESFSILAMCAAINVLHITFGSKCEIVNSVLTFGFLALCITIPLTIGIFLILKLPRLGEGVMKTKYG